METQGQKDARVKVLLASIALTKTGYAGVDKHGNKVDRRENPDAAPLQYNPMMNIPHPKTVVWCTECDFKGGYEDLITRTYRNGGDGECCPNCKTNEYLIEK